MTIGSDMEMRTQYPRDPADSIIVLAAMALALVLGFLAMLDWAPLHGTGSPGAQSFAAASVCRRCGVIESVSSMDTARIGSTAGVAIRGFGDELMSVLALVAGALIGNLNTANKTAIQEVTVRFEDGTMRVFRIAGGPRWQSGDRVKVSRATSRRTAESARVPSGFRC